VVPGETGADLVEDTRLRDYLRIIRAEVAARD
jgi:hypothetical protein